MICSSSVTVINEDFVQKPSVAPKPEQVVPKCNLTLFTLFFLRVSLFVCVADLNMQYIFSINWLPGIFNF